MYIVRVGNTKIYDPRIDELALIDPVVELEENCAGSFSFTIPSTHPQYDLIQKRKSVIQVYQDDELIFSGMAIETKVDFFKQKTVYCEGELSYLNDSIQRPARYQGITVRGLLETYINNHNAQVEAEKQFNVGMVTVTDSNNSLYCYSNMESTMQCLKEDLCDDLGGYFRIRHSNGVKYIDYLADSMNTCRQVIRLGENLIDFNSNIDSTDIATAIIPLGAKLDDSPVEGLEVRLDIKSVNNGLDYVCSQTAIQNYGWIYKTVEWDNVTTASALKKKGQQYLSEIQFENMVIEAKAIDLHFVDSDEERIRLLDQIRVISPPHGLNKNFRITKQTIDLNNPENDIVTLGKEERVSLSAKTNQVNDSIYKAMESIVPPSSILRQAKNNATALINGGASGGYIVIDVDKNGKGELLIMDTPSKDTASKIWRWNINGLGYSKEGYSGTYGLAMTMDGEIVADFITAGTMSADRMRGGTLEVGGTGYGKDGKIEVKNESGTVLVTLDKNGMKLTNGQTIEWASVSGANDAVTKITKDTVTTSYIEALKVKAGSVDAENITGTKITGKTISGGSMNVKDVFKVSSAGKMTCTDADVKGKVTATSGKVANFTINDDSLTVGDAKLNRYRMGCGLAGKGIINIVGNKDGNNSKYGYIQISNSGTHETCLDGIRIYGNGLVEKYNDEGNVVWSKWLSNLP